MLTDSDKQVAALAVSRFGADRARVYEILAAVRRAQAVGRPTDFLDALLDPKLPTPSHARKVRFALADTHVDPDPEQGGATPPPESLAAAHEDEVPRDQEDLIGELNVRVINGYRILAFLGGGGMGAVYRAYHEAEDRYVAIKVLADNLARNQAFV